MYTKFNILVPFFGEGYSFERVYNNLERLVNSIYDQDYGKNFMYNENIYIVEINFLIDGDIEYDNYNKFLSDILYVLIF